MCKKVKNNKLISELSKDLSLGHDGSDVDIGEITPGSELPFIGVDDPSLLTSKVWAYGYNTRTEKVLRRDTHLLDKRGVFFVSSFFEADNPFKFGDPTIIPAVSLKDRYSILTVPANDIISQVHSRMPAYLRKDQFSDFLRDKDKAVEFLEAFL